MISQLVRKYGVTFLLASCIAYWFYRQGKDDAVFAEKIESIELFRRSIQDSLQVIRRRTAARDEYLRRLILRDAEIIDTLNSTLKKLNAGSKEIERKIVEHKTKIDDLWIRR